MNQPLYAIDSTKSDTYTKNDHDKTITALESGQIIYFPNYFFSTHDVDLTSLLTETILDGKHKNISFDYERSRLSGYQKNLTPTLITNLTLFMQAYAQFAKAIIDRYLPLYSSALRWGRTSYRPAEITGRASSKRKDDTRLHVDSFAATPVNGLRILRIFCNINPIGKPRVWHVGEPFEQVLQQFAPKIPAYSALKANCLHWIGATKTLRSAYDHYQLHLHDAMKLDERYQCRVTKQQIDFPAPSTWVVFTDYVSHAALSGQFLLEQTFYLPVSAMAHPDYSPLKCWEKEKNGVLVTLTA